MTIRPLWRPRKRARSFPFTSWTDSQPFNRIMAPTVQPEKFNAAEYIRRWVPELSALSDDLIHDPGDQRPASYPHPIIGHRDARQRALATFRHFIEARGARGSKK